MITREEAVALVGEWIVAEAEAANVEVEQWIGNIPATLTFSASIDIDNTNIDYTGIKVYYYQDASVVNTTEDLSNLDWQPVGYKVW